MFAHHRRIQHAVGQGFFHSGEIRYPLPTERVLKLAKDIDEVVVYRQRSDEVIGPYPFRYIYDCGSKDAPALKVEIDAYLKARMLETESVEAPDVDILFISHFHSDHISGLSRLLQDPPGKSRRRPGEPPGVLAKTVVLPFLEPEERLAAYADALENDIATADDPFFREMIVDPVATLLARGVRTIVLVRRDGEGGVPGGAPVGGGDPPSSEGGAEPSTRASELTFGTVESDRKWIFIGATGAIQRKTRGEIEIPHTSALALEMKSPTLATRLWLFGTYVDPVVEVRRQAFLEALLAEGYEKDRLADTDTLRQLVTLQKGALVRAYETVGDLNLTSLCLYSGPSGSVAPAWTALDEDVVIESSSSVDQHRVGWLATGDAKLTGTRLDAFENHYGRLLRRVATLTVPHHGSTGYSDERLYKSVLPRRCVAAAAAHKDTWRHPATDVVRYIGDQGISLSVVTKSPKSKLTEEFLFQIG